MRQQITALCSRQATLVRRGARRGPRRRLAEAGRRHRAAARVARARRVGRGLLRRRLEATDWGRRRGRELVGDRTVRSSLSGQERQGIFGHDAQRRRRGVLLDAGRKRRDVRRHRHVRRGTVGARGNEDLDGARQRRHRLKRRSRRGHRRVGSRRRRRMDSTLGHGGFTVAQQARLRHELRMTQVVPAYESPPCSPRRSRTRRAHAAGRSWPCDATRNAAVGEAGANLHPRNARVPLYSWANRGTQAAQNVVNAPITGRSFGLPLYGVYHHQVTGPASGFCHSTSSLPGTGRHPRPAHVISTGQGAQAPAPGETGLGRGGRIAAAPDNRPSHTNRIANVPRRSVSQNCVAEVPGAASNASPMSLSAAPS